MVKRMSQAAKAGGAGAPPEVFVSMRTDTGCVREANEDCGRVFESGDPARVAGRGLLAVVADGMGGHAAGEVASRMAVEAISDVYYRGRGEAAAALKRAFAEANRRIFAAAQGDAELRGMGTTATALALLNGTAVMAHVGDSRLYLLRGGEMYLLTEDHSAVMEMVKLGVITPEQARTHADKNVILRALGTNPEVEISTWDEPLPVRAGDQFLLSSDGLHDLVEDAQIKATALAAPGPHEACERLVALARERGGHDNITVGIVSLSAPGRRPRVTRDLEAQA